MMYVLDDLTPGELVWLTRKRAGLTQREMARATTRSEHTIRAYERDEIRPRNAGAIDLGGKALTKAECCRVARRRAGLSLRALAATLRTSHVTLLKRERAGGLVSYWDKRGWPRSKR